MDMKEWLPGTFGASSVDLEGDSLQEGYEAHQRCASRCVSEGVTVDASLTDAAGQAADVLTRCGVTHLVGAFDGALLDRVQRAVEKLRGKSKQAEKLIDRKQLHDGRFQLYLPFSTPFDDRSAIGASSVVLGALDGYLNGLPYGIDHVSVLTSSSPNGNQSLHPDTSAFRRSQLSVHTALQDIPLEMGPTYFCPCTGESGEDWAMSAAIKMVVLKRRECLAHSYAPGFTRRGTVSIYDGSTFHKGLENKSGRNRDVLKLEIGTGNFPQRRGYTLSAPRLAQRQMDRFREVLGVPRFGPLESSS